MGSKLDSDYADDTARQTIGELSQLRSAIKSLNGTSQTTNSWLAAIFILNLVAVIGAAAIHFFGR